MVRCSKKQVARKINKLREDFLQDESYLLFNEADTRDTLINSFLSAFGWDPGKRHNEVIIDTGDGKGYIDYVLRSDGTDQVVVEAKRTSVTDEDLKESIPQLAKYFNSTSAHIGILTNGIEYWFFSWKENAPQMDLRPFARVNIQQLDLTRRDNFIMHLQYNKFNIKLLKWFSHADFKRWSIYSLLGKRYGGDNSRLARKVFFTLFKDYTLDGKHLSRKYIKEAYELTKYHSRYNFIKDNQEW